jgi:peptidoglycan/LPS O-acetylase OafA/YrhL
VPRVAEHPRGELRALTALRFALALYALLYHVLFAWNPFVRVESGHPLAAVLSAGYVSVNGFFVLSGFVLAYVYADTPGATAHPPARTFFRARFARVFPMHAVGILLSLPLLVAAERSAHVRGAALVDEAWREVVVVGLLVQAWMPGSALDLNGPSWSLSVEAFFYALFPFLLRRLANVREIALGLVAAAAFAVTVLVPLVYPLEGGIETPTLSDRVLLYDPLVHLPEFVLGVTAGILYLRRRPDGLRWRFASAAAACALAGALTMAPRIPAGLLHGGILDPLFALLIYALAAGWGTSTRGTRSLLGLLGRASYSLYILHKPIYLWMTRETGLGRRVPPAGFIAGYVVVSLAVSVVLWWGVEEPMRRKLRG